MDLRLAMDPTGGIVSYVITKLADLIRSEVALLGNTKEDLELVKIELEGMQAFLMDAANMEAIDYRVKFYIKQIRKLALQTEDVVETLFVRLGNAKPRFIFNRLLVRTKSRHDFGTKIKRLRKKLDAISKTIASCQISIPKTNGGPLQSSMSREAHYVEDEDAVGLDCRAKAVSDLLEREGSRRAVVPIVGMSGIGKTTLARKIYTNLQSSFDCRAWVDASCRGNTTDLVRRIARDIMNLSPEDEEKIKPDAFGGELSGFLQSKKYLIVLDDVRDPTTWRQLDVILPDGGKGSRIIITAGGEEVAANPEKPPLPPYKLPPLDEEEGRILFTKNAFPGEGNPEQCCPEELRGLRDEFVRKCRGLPIAIIVLGRLLSTKEETHDSWSEVRRKMDRGRTTNEEQCKEILKLSYENLPLHLRWCFLFLAALPEVCEVSTMLLKRLWIAEGFIQEQRGKPLEETAEIYLEELIQRGLVHIVDRAVNGSAQVCRVHDLFLQLATLSAWELDFLDVWRNTSEYRHKDALRRRLSLTYDRNRKIGRLPLGSNKLRTLVIMDRKDWERRQGEQIEAENNIPWSNLRKNLELLRVLALGSHIKPLPEKLVSMANLRYLELSGGNITELPLSLGNLRQLQTLDIERTKVHFLPKSIWQIKTLRHLHGSVESTGLVKPDANPPDDTFQELRALRSIRADSWAEHISPATLEYLKELEIHRDSEDPAANDERLYRTIESRKGLNVLVLVGRKCSHDGRIAFDIGKIFQSACHMDLHTLELSELWVKSSDIEELPKNLKQVTLAYAKIDHGLIELLGKLPSLHLLTLCEVSVVEEEMIFESGWFPLLHVLVVDGLNILKWELKEQSLPQLREFEISRCSELEALPGRLWNISTLKPVTFPSCSGRTRELRSRRCAPY